MVSREILWAEGDSGGILRAEWGSGLESGGQNCVSGGILRTEGGF